MSSFSMIWFLCLEYRDDSDFYKRFEFLSSSGFGASSINLLVWHVNL